MRLLATGDLARVDKAAEKGYHHKKRSRAAQVTTDEGLQQGLSNSSVA